MRSFDVHWTILLDAEDEQAAAEGALAIMRDPESTALVFNVTEVDDRDGLPLPDSRRVTVDLA
jgi:hypothetical protein